MNFFLKHRLSQKSISAVLALFFLIVGGFLARPSLAEYALNKAGYYFNGGAYDLSVAVKLYKVADFLGSKSPLVHYQLARIYFVENNLDEAKREIDIALAKNPENQRAFYIRGLVDGFAQNYEEAISDFEKFTAWSPKEWAGWNDLAWVSYEANDYAKAKEAALNGLKINENNPWLLNNLGLAYVGLGEKDEAQAIFKKTKKNTATLTLEEWQKAYPGNNPNDAELNLAKFKDNVKYNATLASIQDPLGIALSGIAASACGSSRCPSLDTLCEDVSCVDYNGITLYGLLPKVEGTVSGFGDCSVTCGGGTQTQTCDGASCGGNCNGAALSQNCNTQSCVVPGECGATHNDCSKGTLGATAEDPTRWVWGCVGSDGISVGCSEWKPVPVDGVCAATHYDCAPGNPGFGSDLSDRWTWTCLSPNGDGAADSCTEMKGCNCGDTSLVCDVVTYSDGCTADACTGTKCCGGSCGGCTPVNATLGDWGDCSTTCGPGTETRTCSGANSCGDATCGGAALSRGCNLGDCPPDCTPIVNATLSEWGACPPDCSIRTRTCGGAQCPGAITTCVGALWQYCDNEPCIGCTSTGCGDTSQSCGTWLDNCDNICTGTKPDCGCDPYSCCVAAGYTSCWNGCAYVDSPPCGGGTPGACSSPSVLNTCANGTTFSDLTDTATNYQWKCLGSGGGSDSGTCTAPIVCTPNNCAINTCSTDTCWNGCTTVPGTKCCCDPTEAPLTCIGDHYEDSCGDRRCPGTMDPSYGPPSPCSKSCGGGTSTSHGTCTPNVTVTCNTKPCPPGYKEVTPW